MNYLESYSTGRLLYFISHYSCNNVYDLTECYRRIRSVIICNNEIIRKGTATDGTREIFNMSMNTLRGIKRRMLREEEIRIRNRSENNIQSRNINDIISERNELDQISFLARKTLSEHLSINNSRENSRTRNVRLTEEEEIEYVVTLIEESNRNYRRGIVPGDEFELQEEEESYIEISDENSSEIYDSESTEASSIESSETN